MRKAKAVLAIIAIVLMLAVGSVLVVFLARDSEHKKIVVTSYPIYDICREILGSDEDIQLLQDDGSDLHAYAPTTMDIASISRAKLFVYIGGHSDSWVEGVVRAADNVNLRTLSLMSAVDPLHESTDNIISGGQEHEGHDHEEHDDCIYDEHIWLSIRNMQKMTNAVLKELILVYPHMEQMLKSNAEDYIDRLAELDEQYNNITSSKDTTIVLADRFPLLYLAHDYGINFVAGYHGCSSDTQASPDLILNLIEVVKSNNLKYILQLEGSDGKIAQGVANGCGGNIRVLEINSCQSIGGDKVNISYIDIMTSNLETIRMALNNEFN